MASSGEVRVSGVPVGADDAVTLVSSTDDRFRTGVDALAPLVAADVVAGIHLEGPFLALSQCGAHEPTLLRDPDVRLVDELAGLGGRQAGDGDVGARACRRG